MCSGAGLDLVRKARSKVNQDNTQIRLRIAPNTIDIHIDRNPALEPTREIDSAKAANVFTTIKSALIFASRILCEYLIRIISKML